MIIGIGIDIIEVDRIERAMQKNGFVERMFTPAEIACFERMNHNPQTVAGAFAAKEAVAKALGTGFSAGVGFKDIELTHDEKGKPVIALFGGALARAEQLGGNRVHISISHIKSTAVAEAILEG